VATVVEAYFSLLQLDISGQSFNKSAHYRSLAEITGRSPKSIERKFQNISAILDLLGHPWITGLAPLANFQQALAREVEQRLPSFDIQLDNSTTKIGLEESRAIFIEQAPNLEPQPEVVPDYMERLARKFDPVLRDSRNRTLGMAGEMLALKNERERLITLGRPNLAEKIQWVSDEQGDGAGYDILSYEPDGKERFVEVKTTNGHSRTPFFITKNELGFAKETGEQYVIFRLFDFARMPRAYEMSPPFDEKIKLEPQLLKASFR